MSIRVDNLADLFWDNGSYKYPNTYPKLIRGVTLKKVPVMTSPTAGWVILEGDWNYCEFNGDLFFLKKDRRISTKRNKWRYILIKDHICTLFKNKADVYASGTMTNTDIDNLSDNDFQYTFPVFNNYNERIIVPLQKEPFNWRRHFNKEKALITKKFDWYAPSGDKEFTEFVKTLENNKDLLNAKPWNQQVQQNNYLVLLGRLGQGKLIKGWKNELVEKINKFIEDLPARDDVVLGPISNVNMRNATKLNGKYAISWSSENPLFTVSTENKEIDIDLSGLTDIELINFDNPSPGEKYAIDYFNLFLTYNEDLLSQEYTAEGRTFICKLSRRVRLPFLNQYTSRAVYKKGGKLHPVVWVGGEGEADSGWRDNYYPQKIFIKVDKPLTPKAGFRARYPSVRYKDTYRSVYLYWCWNLNFYFAWGWKIGTDNYKEYGERTWIHSAQLIVERDTKQREAASDRYMYLTQPEDICVIPMYAPRTERYWERDDGLKIEFSKGYLLSESYSNYYPWGRGGYSDIKEPLNIGWLLGQFSSYIKGQEGQYETEFPFIMKTAVIDRKQFKRIKGFKPIVSKLIQMKDAYLDIGDNKDKPLDIFTLVPRRTIEIKEEEDFLIGEKLLFTTWGMAPYLLFQPFSMRYWEAYGAWRLYGWYYPDQVLGDYLTGTSWYYVYYIFDSGNYFSNKAKGLFQKAYEDFAILTPYERFYSNDKSYKKLKQHAVKNTEAYFEIDNVRLKNTPIKSLSIGDIFYSELEWFWFDQGEGRELVKVHESDFFRHRPTIELAGNKNLKDEDTVIYLNPKDKKLYIGTVNVWNSTMQLPDNQYIAEGSAISNSSSSNKTISTRYVKITPSKKDTITGQNIGYDSIDELLSVLKQPNTFKQQRPVSLQSLVDLGRNYLFNLKGTPFFCCLDRLGRVSLVFKNKPQYEESEHIPN